jgi:hypothetical protein
MPAAQRASSINHLENLRGYHFARSISAPNQFPIKSILEQMASPVEPEKQLNQYF